MPSGFGSGKLALSHFNTYTGGTVLKQGKLRVNNVSGSAPGSGPLQVNGGGPGGKGIIAGAVTVGTGSGNGAKLAPGYVHGANSPGTLTIQSLLTFNSDGIYVVGVNSSFSLADEVAALGVTINNGAQFAFVDLGSGILFAGTVFMVINNTAANPIEGTFSDLPENSTFTSNGNTYQVSYHGGDGNDLTLRSCPSKSPYVRANVPRGIRSVLFALVPLHISSRFSNRESSRIPVSVTAATSSIPTSPRLG